VFSSARHQTIKLVDGVVERVTSHYLETVGCVREIHCILALPSIRIQIEPIGRRFPFQLLFCHTLQFSQRPIHNQNLDQISIFAGKMASSNTADTPTVDANLSFEL
jgi:hypothetical protein